MAQATWGSDLVPPDKKGTPVVTVNCTLLLGGGEVATMNELWDVSRLPLSMVDCPYLRQEPNSCTATSLAMLLAWAGICDHQAVLKSWKDMEVALMRCVQATLNSSGSFVTRAEYDMNTALAACRS